MEETAIALPDDAVREILARVVDPVSLFRCATACKWWRVLVADLSFLRRRWPADSPQSSSVFGFFAPQLDDSEPVFVPAPQSPLGVDRRSLGSLFPEAASSLDRAEPLVAVAAAAPSTWPSATRSLAHVCSRGQSPLPGYSTFFEVLIIADVPSKDSSSDCSWSRYDLHMFASNESSWAAPTECFNRRGFINPGRQRSGVVRRGTAHWIFSWSSSYYILQVSADTGHVSFAKVSVPPYTLDIAPYLSIAINGTLSLLRLSRQGNQLVENWTCKDGDTTSAWLCTRMFELERPKQDRAMAIWVGERSGELLFVDLSIHIAELETGATEDVTAQFSGIDYLLSVPFEVDWTAFFSSRLGLGGRN
ncbi:hypothetical protein ACQ4PT_055455 [Festuca glaucescens]